MLIERVYYHNRGEARITTHHLNLIRQILNLDKIVLSKINKVTLLQTNKKFKLKKNKIKIKD